jgi:CRISPR system Cascade subunit CasC
MPPRFRPKLDLAGGFAMTTPRFVQVHSLIAYSAALLNRDDSGLAKRLPFGGATRTRISSQCLKRHWRVTDDEWALSKIGPEMAVRSRKIPEERILPALEQAGIGTPDTRNATCDALAVALYSKTAAKDPSSRQALLIGEPEIAYLIDKAKAAAGEADAKAATTSIETLFKKEEKKNLSAMLEAKGALNAGLEAALFGRMVTSDPDANTDAAVHVAHAFTVHREEAETDYFTVVDDLETGTGAGGIFDTELTTGLFYVYVVVDVSALIANLADDATLAGKVVEHLVHLIATVSPGAKRGSTAPYAYADLVFVESGTRQPRSLANAFREASRPTVADATAKLAAHLSRIDAMYGAKETRRVASLDPQIALPGASAAVPLDALAEAVAAEVAGV